MGTVIDLQVAVDKIRGFDTAEDIAGFLIDQGVTGLPGSRVACPIAMWLRRTTGRMTVVTAGQSRCGDRIFRHNPAMRSFIEEWDRDGLRRWPPLSMFKREPT